MIELTCETHTPPSDVCALEREKRVVGPSSLQSRCRNGAGLIDADLGGSVLKKRVALPGRGKSGGVRVIVATPKVDRWVFLYGFEKNERDNISKKELKIFQEMAVDLLKLNDRQVDLALSEGEFVEVVNETKENHE